VASVELRDVDKHARAKPALHRAGRDSAECRRGRNPLRLTLLPDEGLEGRESFVTGALRRCCCRRSAGWRRHGWLTGLMWLHAGYMPQMDAVWNVRAAVPWKRRGARRSCPAGRPCLRRRTAPPRQRRLPRRGLLPSLLVGRRMFMAVNRPGRPGPVPSKQRGLRFPEGVASMMKPRIPSLDRGGSQAVR
jgi:hypothetical protein